MRPGEGSFFRGRMTLALLNISADEAYAFFAVALLLGIGAHRGFNSAKQDLILALEYYYAGEAICKRYPDYRIR